jgi:hypothetical protein
MKVVDCLKIERTRLVGCGSPILNLHVSDTRLSMTMVLSKAHNTDSNTVCYHLIYPTTYSQLQNKSWTTLLTSCFKKTSSFLSTKQNRESHEHSLMPRLKTTVYQKSSGKIYFKLLRKDARVLKLQNFRSSTNSSNWRQWRSLWPVASRLTKTSSSSDPSKKNRKMKVKNQKLTGLVENARLFLPAHCQWVPGVLARQNCVLEATWLTPAQ